MGRDYIQAAMTALSCLALGFGFAIAVGLLVFASVVIGWVIPHRRREPRRDR
jgi:shikimate kinase